MQKVLALFVEHSIPSLSTFTPFTVTVASFKDNHYSNKKSLHRG